MNKKHLTEAEQEELLLRVKRNYTYDAATGRLTSSRLGRAVKGAKRDKRDYLCVLCRLGKKRVHVYLHHAVWAACKGRWPEGQIDHVNGNIRDNSIENLREVSPSENNMNMLHPWELNAKTELPGVSSHGRKYQIRIFGKVCRFLDPNEAFYHATMCGKRYRDNKHETINNNQ